MKHGRFGRKLDRKRAAPTPPSIPLHKRWRTLSVACLPLSAAAGILPGPNVFLLYNGTACPEVASGSLLTTRAPPAFRVYSHHLALNHAIHLVDLLKNDAVRAVTSEQFSAAFTTWDRKSLIPDSIMDTIAAGIGEGGADYWSHVDRARKQFRKKSDQPS